MSVIIRLQNLPWNANALDIRRYFHGLSIPDGGVHIIGGENGDTFIAFSTDEDARQAMQKDNGRINGIQIKLLLSSKTEMQNVIAAAKNGGPPSMSQPGPAASKVGGFYDRSGAAPGAPPYGGGDPVGGIPGLGAPAPSSYGYPADDFRQPASYGRIPEDPRSAMNARPLPGKVSFEPPAGMRAPDRAAPGLDVPAVPFRGPAEPAPSPRGTGVGDGAGAAWGSSQRGYGPESQDYGRGSFSRDSGRFGDGGRGLPDAERDFARAREQYGRDFGMSEPGRDFTRTDPARPFDGADEQREFGRFMGDRSGLTERDLGRPEDRDFNRPDARGNYFSGDGGRGYNRMDIGRDYPPSGGPRDMPGQDRWMGDRGGVRDLPPGPGAVRGEMPRDAGFNRFDVDRSRFPPDGSGPGYGQDRGPFRPMGPGYGGQQPPFQDPRMQEDNLLPPPPATGTGRWGDEPRGFDPRYDQRRPGSPPRDRYGMPGGDGFNGGGRGPQWFDGGMDGARGPQPGVDLTVHVSNLPRSFNYREVRRFFSNCEIPGDGLKLINDRSGRRTGTAYVRFFNHRSLMAAVDMNGTVVEDCKVRVERCTDRDYEGAIDSAPGARGRSRSPRRRSSDESSNSFFFVVKKLPSKVDKAAVKKFFGNFRIPSNGGPFFEVAFNDVLTGNVLVEIEKVKDISEILKLHHTMLNGSRVDVINISKGEFEDRTKKARQLERDGGKDATASKSSSSFTKEKKDDKTDSKPKEQDKSSSSEGERKTHCIIMRGLPFHTTPEMLTDFFTGLDIAPNGIHIVYNREHRAAGIGYVEFLTATDQKKALEKDKKYLGHRYLEIRPISHSAMMREYRANQPGGISSSEVILVEDDDEPTTPAARSGGSGSDCSTLCMQNLHSNTQLEDILDFFRGYHPIVDSIKLQYKDGQPTGDGLVKFPTAEEAQSAMRTKNRNLLLGKPVALSIWKN